MPINYKSTLEIFTLIKNLTFYCNRLDKPIISVSLDQAIDITKSKFLLC